MADPTILVRLSADDINHLAATFLDGKPIGLRYDDGCLVAAIEFGPITITATLHFDLTNGRLSVIVPFRELRGSAGWLARPVLKSFWNLVEVKAESAFADQLSAHGLPWDMVWVDHSQDPDGHKVATINVSPVILNDWLSHLPLPGDMAPKLAGLEVLSDALVVKAQLVAWVPPPGSAAPDQAGAAASSAALRDAPPKGGDTDDGGFVESRAFGL